MKPGTAITEAFRFHRNSFLFDRKLFFFDRKLFLLDRAVLLFARIDRDISILPLHAILSI
jgi:hypothetical protein